MLKCQKSAIYHLNDTLFCHIYGIERFVHKKFAKIDEIRLFQNFEKIIFLTIWLDVLKILISSRDF